MSASHPLPLATKQGPHRTRPVLSILFLISLTAVTNSWVNLRQPSPYMDELFHVPQAKRFCAGLTTRTPSVIAYSPSITTPPGPYLLPALLSTVSAAFCSTAALRALSALFTVLIFLELRKIIAALTRRQPLSIALQAHTTSPDLSLKALLLTLNPVIFFYSNLFYTDPPSIYFLLLSYRLALSHAHALSALSGFFSTLHRQTSAPFHAYIALDALIASKNLSTALPHAAAGLIYIALLALNSFSIALGDQPNHTPAIHTAMLPYQAVFILISSLPIILAMVTATRSPNQPLPSPTFTLPTLATFIGVTVLTTTCIASTGTFIHPFALADNRHYTFYIYRYLLSRPAVRALIVPLSALALVAPFIHVRSIYQAVVASSSTARPARRQDLSSWCLAELLRELCLVLITAACVVPASLLELRYFIPGFLLAATRLLSRVRIIRGKALLAVAALLAANIALVFVFCERPFVRAVDKHMPEDPSPGRFMF